MKIHFSTCFNRFIERFVQNYDFNQDFNSGDINQVSNLLEYLPFFSLNNEELNELNFLNVQTVIIPKPFPNFIDQLSKFVTSENIHIFHLNVNSLQSKLHELSPILHSKMFDLLFINETKLDESIPNSFAMEIFKYQPHFQEKT